MGYPILRLTITDEGQSFLGLSTLQRGFGAPFVPLAPKAYEILLYLVLAKGNVDEACRGAASIPLCDHHGLRILLKEALLLAMRAYERLSHLARVRKEALFIFPACGAGLDRGGNVRLVTLENVYISLISANAYFSTIGGGAYLTRLISDAVLQALKQVRVARLLQSPSMEARCWVNVAYCEIQLGRFKTAMRRLKALGRLGRLTDDTTLSNMSVAGKKHCRDVWNLVCSGELVLAEVDLPQGAANSKRHISVLSAASRHPKVAKASQGPGRGSAVVIAGVRPNEFHRFRLARVQEPQLPENKEYGRWLL
jgi:Domain of unknown function (DUF4807)